MNLEIEGGRTCNTLVKSMRDSGIVVGPVLGKGMVHRMELTTSRVENVIDITKRLDYMIVKSIGADAKKRGRVRHRAVPCEAKRETSVSHRQLSSRSGRKSFRKGELIHDGCVIASISGMTHQNSTLSQLSNSR
jgi:hypothetical protein